MDGFVEASRAGSATAASSTPTEKPCPQAELGPQGQPDVMGYHTDQEIPNYWAYAEQYQLQDRMFAPTRLVDAARPPVPGLGLVGDCARTATDAHTCRQSEVGPAELATSSNDLGADAWASPPYVWADITWLLVPGAACRWALLRRRAARCVVPPCAAARGHDSDDPLQNPLPGFTRPCTPPASSTTSRRMRSSSAPQRPASCRASPGSCRPRPRASTRARAGHRDGTGMRDPGGQRRDGRPARAVGAHRDLPHVGRLGRVLRPREAARGRRERLRDSGCPAS